MQELDFRKPSYTLLFTCINSNFSDSIITIILWWEIFDHILFENYKVLYNYSEQCNWKQEERRQRYCNVPKMEIAIMGRVVKCIFTIYLHTDTTTKRIVSIKHDIHACIYVTGINQTRPIYRFTCILDFAQSWSLIFQWTWYSFMAIAVSESGNVKNGVVEWGRFD